jgi:hypothetical protein
MSDVLTRPNPKTDADYDEMALKMLEEMSRLEELMDKARAERDRLKLENTVIKASTEAKLARLEQQVCNLSKAN